jgi:hypothetical protein
LKQTNKPAATTTAAAATETAATATVGKGSGFAMVNVVVKALNPTRQKTRERFVT